MSDLRTRSPVEAPAILGPLTETRLRDAHGCPLPHPLPGTARDRRAGTRVLAIARALPPTVVGNQEVAAPAGLTEEWIVQRTGVRERRRAAPGTCPSALGAEAARRAMAEAGVAPEELGFILCATVTPDSPMPSTACLLQAELGAARVPALELNAACSGFLYGWKVADSLMRADATMGPVLLVTTEIMSTVVDPEDPQTCAIFGDGAAAVVLGRSAPDTGLLGCTLGADGARGHLIEIPAGGAVHPASHETVDHHDHFIHMKGREVFKLAVSEMIAECEALLDRVGLRPEDVARIIPHQANTRILDAVGRHLGVADRIHVNITRVGNTASASIPLALAECVEEGSVKPGDYVLLTAFGAGLTWGAALVRW